MSKQTKEELQNEKLDGIIAWIKSNPWGQLLIERIRNGQS